MGINLKEIMAEYAQLPFEPLGTSFHITSAGHIQKGYHTNLSAFLFPLRGKAQFNLSENSYDFRPGKVIHACPGRWLTAQNKTNLQVEFFKLYYYYDGNNAGYMHCSYELEIGINPRVISMLQQLAVIWKKQNEQQLLQSKTLVYAILTEIFSAAQSALTSGASAIVDDAKAYMEQRYMEPHTLCELGNRYGLCGKYFSDVFKKYAGISPINYLINYRMQQAKKLLETTECSILDISKSLGYKDPKYFSRQFRENFRAPPNAWREELYKNRK